MSEKSKVKHCDWCRQPMDEIYWQNIVKWFCSLECTNGYLESEGFNPIEGPDESASTSDGSPTVTDYLL